MKRKLALLILVILAVSVVLVACNNAETTKVEPRWENNEKHVFHVTLADFSSRDDELFNTYDNAYRKDRGITNESLYTRDEICPTEVCGTYTMTITKNTGLDTCVVKGEQVIYLKYMIDATSQTGVQVDLSQWADLQTLAAKVTDEELAETHLKREDGYVILKSVTNTEVEFHNQSQQPIQSKTAVDGFYVGLAHREVTNYSISTTYDFSGKKPSATVTFKNTVSGVDSENTYQLASNASSNLIDSNQILIYVRSLGKTSGSLQDNKSVNVFDPLSHSTQTASFAYMYQDKVVLTDSSKPEGEQELFTTVNAVAVTVGNNAFMMQDNLPETVKQDTILSGGETLSKLTTVHFRVGYLSYEIEYSNEENTAKWGEIWEALTPKTEPDDEESQPQD